MWFRWGINFAIFLLAFASVGGWLREQRPWERHIGVADRIRHLYSADPAYDTVFFGSSRLHGGLSPAVFDRRMAELGHPTRSLSLALVGMRPHEVDVVLRKLLDDPPPGLRRIVVELQRWIPTVAEENRFKPRTCAWHTPGQLSSILISELRWSNSLEQWAAPALLDHVGHCLAYWTNLGEGPSIWKEWRRPRDLPPRAVERLEQQRGFAPLSAEDNAEAAKRRRRFEEDVDVRYPRLVERKRSGRADAQEGDIVNPEALLEQCHRVLASGIDLVYLIAPSVVGVQVPEWMTGEDALVPCIRFDRPEEYPELFAPEVMFDLGHLNPDGAELWSAMLAERFVETL